MFDVIANQMDELLLDRGQDVPAAVSIEVEESAEEEVSRVSGLRRELET
jgi:hypothetical protein